jgi:hypothetical protein
MKKYKLEKIENTNSLEGATIKLVEINILEETVNNTVFGCVTTDKATLFRSEGDMFSHFKGNMVDSAVISKGFLEFIPSDIWDNLIDNLPWTSQEDGLVWDIISPDGFSFWRDERNIKDIEEAEKIFKEEIMPRFKHQGYYSGVEGQILLDELKYNCRFIKREPFLDDED